jgi:hypothetical protein
VSFSFLNGTRWNLTYIYVPSSKMIRISYRGAVYWRKAPQLMNRAVARATERIRPFPQPRAWR